MPVPFHLRLLAMVVDAMVGALVALILAPTALGHFFSSRAVVLLRIGEPGSWFKGPVAMIMGVLGEFVFLLPLALALALAAEVVGSRGLGKRLCRIRIAGPARRAFVVRYLIKISPLWLSVLALLSGVWMVEMIALASALALLLGWLVAAFTGGDALQDRVAGTRLERS